MSVGLAVGLAGLLTGAYGGYQATSAQKGANVSNERIARENREFQGQMFEKGNVFSAGQAEIDRDFQSRQADVNRLFQERMSSTAYRRSVEDLKAGGINPMLAYMKPPASTPSGAMAHGARASSVGAPSGATATMLRANKARMITEGISSALELSRARNAVKKIASDVEVNKEVVKTQKTVQEMNQASARRSDTQSHINRLNFPAVGSRANFDTSMMDMSSENKMLMFLLQMMKGLVRFGINPRVGK